MHLLKHAHRLHREYLTEAGLRELPVSRAFLLIGCTLMKFIRLAAVHSMLSPLFTVCYGNCNIKCGDSVSWVDGALQHGGFG